MQQPPADPTADTPTWRFRIFIDGGCPLCAREATLMEKLDRGRGQLDIVDIADPSFDATRFEHHGRPLTYERFMATIHGQEPDGRIISGLEVFRRTYEAVGWGWVLGWTRLPGVRWLAERAYDLFAKYRLRVTGRRDACEIPPAEATRTSA